MPMRRVVLSAFESSRRPTWTAIRQQALGFGVEGVLIATFVAGGYLERRAAAAAAARGDEMVSFLAPVQRASPPPSEERISFVAIGNAPITTDGALAPPSDNGNQQLKLTAGAEAVDDANSMPVPDNESMRAMSEIEVDSTAALDSTAVGPEYPAEMMKKGIEGVVYAQFTVDATGYADTLTLQVLAQVDPAFERAVRNALPRMKYKPAVFSGRRVSQLVQQAFVFKIQPPAGD